MRRLLLIVGALLAFAAPGMATAAATMPALDGLRIGHLPAGLGGSTDFRYEYDDVGFVSRDWESRTADGWRVDLTVEVLRGDHVGTPSQMHDWVIAYEERPPAEVGYRRTTVRHRPGWRCADEVFWLLRPGVAVIVRLDTARWPRSELRRIARSVRPAVTRRAGSAAEGRT